MLGQVQGWSMLTDRFNQAGVTLIEMLVTISIVAILAGLAVPSFRTMLLNTQISSSAESILNGLQIARSEAVHRNAPVQFVLGTGSEWTVGCVTVTASCPATIQSSPAGDGSSTDVTVAVTPALATTVAFNNFGAAIVTASSLSQLDVDLPTSVLPASESKDLRVTISAGGGARVCDPNLSSPDVRAC